MTYKRTIKIFKKKYSKIKSPSRFADRQELVLREGHRCEDRKTDDPAAPRPYVSCAVAARGHGGTHRTLPGEEIGIELLVLIELFQVTK